MFDNPYIETDNNPGKAMNTFTWSTKKTGNAFIGIVTENTYHKEPVNGRYSTGVKVAEYKRRTRAQAKSAAQQGVRYFKHQAKAAA